MVRRGDIQASGAVVLRGSGDEREVLVVHRPAYDDWSLPKGKTAPDEYLAVTAVREVREETGYSIRLVRQLSEPQYPVGGRSKRVRWWLAELADKKPGKHDQEADLVEWWPVQRAVTQLSYPDDVAVLTEACRAPMTRPLIIVRHAKAMNRKQWNGPDRDRRLTERGRRQAKALVGLLDAFGVGLVASSSSNRCMRTLAPYAQFAGLEIESVAALSEEVAEESPRGVVKAMAKLVAAAQQSDRPMAICGHRPVLPTMFDFLGVAPRSVLRPGELVLCYPGERGKMGQPTHIAPTL